jgi:hypothetical protein
VQEHAELLLKERSLSSYYDEVALKGLQLAANDIMRGVLSRTQLERIKDAVRDLVAELDTFPDADPVQEEAGNAPAVEPADQPLLPIESAPGSGIQADDLSPAWRRGKPVICVAGRGPLDEAASMMLGQLLEKHGIGARVLAHEAVARHAIEQFPTDGVAMVCISYLDIRGKPSHLRYLLRRLRQRLPHARFLVGLWPAGEVVLTDTALRQTLGADDYVTSLREGVEACLRAARAPASDGARPVAAAAQ